MLFIIHHLYIRLHWSIRCDISELLFTSCLCSISSSYRYIIFSDTQNVQVVFKVNVLLEIMHVHFFAVVCARCESLNRFPLQKFSSITISLRGCTFSSFLLTFPFVCFSFFIFEFEIAFFFFF